MRRRLSLFLQFLVLVAVRLEAADALPPDAAVRAILKERVTSERTAGIVIGILDAGGRRVVAYGDPAGRPLDGDTVFEIGSITKVFTSALLSDMVRRGEVKLEDPLATFSITVTREGNALFLQATGQSKLPVYPESETEFFLKAVDAQITFVKENGRVSRLVLHQNGRDTPGRKVK